MAQQIKEHVEIEEECNPYGLEKIFGVAVLGAIASVGFYFLYQNLGEETKQTVKDSLVSGFKAAIRKDW